MSCDSEHPVLGVITPFCIISLFSLLLNHHINPSYASDYMLRRSCILWLACPEQNILFLYMFLRQPHC